MDIGVIISYISGGFLKMVDWVWHNLGMTGAIGFLLGIFIWQNLYKVRENFALIILVVAAACFAVYAYNITLPTFLDGGVK